MAGKAVETLLSRIYSPDSPARTITISGDLIIKESVRTLS
jgi:DNA-binding LacI/PurR family transcriptional regulator